MAASPPTAPAHDRPYSVEPEETARLPFRVRLARDERDLERIVALRATAYGRHIPAMVTTVDRPEAEDHRPETLLLMAESRTTGQLLGAARLIHNGHVPLKLEQAFGVQGLFQSRFVAEAGRLTVLGIPESRMATLALVKAMYEICFHAGIEWAAITARRPMDRVYLAMQFDDVLNGRKIPYPPVGHLPHGLYTMPIREADIRWRRAACPLYPFMAGTFHPDIDVDYGLVQQRFTDTPAHDATAVTGMRLSAPAAVRSIVSA